MNPFPAIAQDAVAQSMQFAKAGPAVQAAVVLGNILPRLLVPALKQVSQYNQFPRFYTHSAAMTTAATAGDTDTETVSLTANADFLWTSMSVISGTDGAAPFNFDLQIVFGGTDRQFVNKDSGVHPYAFMGAERLPFVLPKAFVIRKRETLTVKITNLDGVAIRNCYVYFIGVDFLDENVLDGTRRVA